MGAIQQGVAKCLVFVWNCLMSPFRWVISYGTKSSGGPSSSIHGGSTSSGRGVNHHLGFHFGVPLQQSVEKAKALGLVHPALHCIDYLNVNGLDVEGVFRVSGDKTQILEWKATFDTGNSVTFPTYPRDHVHDVVGLLKLYLTELPYSLVPSSFFPSYMECQTKEDFLTLLNVLPTANKMMLREICLLLRNISKNSDENKMTVDNLACCLAFTILRPSGDPSLMLSQSSRAKDVLVDVIEHMKSV